MKLKYKRVLIKFSGEALAGKKSFGLDFGSIRGIAKELVKLRQAGVDLAVVVGGGNIFRGRAVERDTIDQATADYMGMIGTIINALALQAEIEKQGAETRVMTALSVKEVAEDYIRRKAQSHLAKGRIVLFAAGTGNPYFTTDTAGSLRAIEISADVILKGTRVDGIYSADPEKDPTATKFNTITFQECLTNNLRVMDMTALTLCMENNLPIIVFDMNKPGNLMKLTEGEHIGTLVK